MHLDLVLTSSHIVTPPIAITSLWSSFCFSHTDMRYAQLVEEQDHKYCTDANRKELLAEKLGRLRALKDEIAKNEWMFEGR